MSADNLPPGSAPMCFRGLVQVCGSTDQWCMISYFLLCWLSFYIFQPSQYGESVLFPIYNVFTLPTSLHRLSLSFIIFLSICEVWSGLDQQKDLHNFLPLLLSVPLQCHLKNIGGTKLTDDGLHFLDIVIFYTYSVTKPQIYDVVLIRLMCRSSN